MDLKRERRIQSYLKFLKDCDRSMALCGITLMIVAIMIYLLLESSRYFFFCVGFGLIGFTLVTKYTFLYNRHSKLGDKEMTSDFETRINKIKKKVKIYSSGLIVSMILSIVIVLIKVKTELLLSIIPIILYSTIEYIVSLLDLFKLNILRQEING